MARIELWCQKYWPYALLVIVAVIILLALTSCGNAKGW